MTASVSQILSAINNLNRSERLEIAEEILKGIRMEESNQYDIPEEHKLILEERLAEYKANPDSVISFDNAAASIKVKYGL